MCCFLGKPGWWNFKHFLNFRPQIWGNHPNWLTFLYFGWLNHQLVNSFDGGKKQRTPESKRRKNQATNSEITEIMAAPARACGLEDVMLPPLPPSIYPGKLINRPLKRTAVKAPTKIGSVPFLNDFKPTIFSPANFCLRFKTSTLKNKKIYETLQWGSPYGRYVGGSYNIGLTYSR